MPRLLAPDLCFRDLLSALEFFQDHGGRHPQLLDLDTVVALILLSVVEPEKLRTSLDMIVVAVRQCEDVEIGALVCFELAAEASRQIDGCAFCRPRLGVLAVVEEEAATVDQFDLTGIAVADGVERDRVHALFLVILCSCRTTVRPAS